MPLHERHTEPFYATRTPRRVVPRTVCVCVCVWSMICCTRTISYQRAPVSCRKPLVRYPLNKQSVKYTIDLIAVPVSIFKL